MATDRTVHETAYRADKVGRWGVRETRQNYQPKRELRISRPSVQRNSFRNNRSILSENRASELWSVRRKQLNSLQGRQEIRQSRPYRKVQPILFKGRSRPQNKRQRLLLRPQKEAAVIAQKTAKTTAKATQKAAQAAKKAAKATADTVKATAKATVAAVKAIIAGTKALVAAIAAGGWIAVLIIMIVVLFGAAVAMFGGGSDSNSYTPVSAEVEAYEPIIQKYAKEYGIPEYVELIKAVMMQESGGRGLDPMQAAEGSFNTKYPHEPNGIKDPEYSIQCGVQELKAALTSAEVESPIDMEHIKLALQGYNFGNGYISWAKNKVWRLFLC